MNVYIVVWEATDDWHIREVFATEAAAKQFIDKQQASDRPYLEIDVWEVRTG